jgi:hypothetical protein
MVQQMSDLQLAEILNISYQKLMEAQSNILVIQKELDNRKAKTSKVEQPKEEASKESDAK